MRMFVLGLLACLCCCASVPLGTLPAIVTDAPPPEAPPSGELKSSVESYLAAEPAIVARPTDPEPAAPTATLLDLGLNKMVAAAEQKPAAGSNAEAQANNPLANMVAFNVQGYFIGDLTESNDSADQFWLRYAKPIAIGDTSWLLRVSLPFNSFPRPGGGTDNGMGDINAFAALLIDMGNPAISFGVGPLLSVPSATRNRLGSEKWSAGIANVLFVATDPKFQFGYLVTYQHSFAGSDARADVSVMAFQPFMFYQLGDGLYLRAAPVWVYDFEGDNYGVPIGVGIGKVIRQGNTVYNVFVEPQYSIADDGPGQPEWQIYFALNMQFLGGK